MAFLLLVFVVGCQTDKHNAPGLHLDYRGKAGHRVIGPIGNTATVLYDFRANGSHELVRVSQVRETSSSVEVAFIYTISVGGAATGPVEQFLFSKSAPTRVTLMTGGEVTGVYR
jgi:hypothetical protein